MLTGRGLGIGRQFPIRGNLEETMTAGSTGTHRLLTLKTPENLPSKILTFSQKHCHRTEDEMFFIMMRFGQMSTCYRVVSCYLSLLSFLYLRNHQFSKLSRRWFYSFRKDSDWTFQLQDFGTQEVHPYSSETISKGVSCFNVSASLHLLTLVYVPNITEPEIM